MFGYDRPTYTYLIRYGVDNGVKLINTKRTDLDTCVYNVEVSLHS